MLKAVIVEDSTVIRKLIRQFLKYAHIEVIGEAEDGLSGLEMILDLKPDIATIDLNLPKLNGEELVKWVQKSKLNTFICIISSIDESVEEAIVTYGVDDVICKPVTMEKIIKMSEKLEKR